jgi:hypothetical protein
MGVARPERKMFQILRSSRQHGIVYLVSGRIDEDAVSELRRLFDLDLASNRLILDLKGVRLVQAEAVEFLARCKDAGIEIRNCPGYVREWIGSITSIRRQIYDRS